MFGAFVDLMLFLVALLYLPHIVGRALGKHVPTPVDILRWAWPGLELAGYLVKRAVCFAWQPLPDDVPYLLRRYVEPPAEELEGENNNAVAPTATTSLQTIAKPQNDDNELLLQGKAYALAVLVRARKIGQTEGIYLVFGEKPSSTNGRYLRARALLQEQLEICENPFPTLTADGRPVASELQR